MWQNWSSEFILSCIRGLVAYFQSIASLWFCNIVAFSGICCYLFIRYAKFLNLIISLKFCLFNVCLFLIILPEAVSYVPCGMQIRHHISALMMILKICIYPFSCWNPFKCDFSYIFAMVDKVLTDVEHCMVRVQQLDLWLYFITAKTTSSSWTRTNGRTRSRGESRKWCWYVLMWLRSGFSTAN